MTKKESKNIPIEIYVSKTQIGYDEFQRCLIVTDGYGYTGYSYKQYDSESISGFHENLISSLRQQEGEIELHFRGKLKSLTDEQKLDGYFGRPEYRIVKEMFLRNLTLPERGYI